MGRFISCDKGGMSFQNPHSINRYAFCYNNPIAFRDSDGNVVIYGWFTGRVHPYMEGLPELYDWVITNLNIKIICSHELKPKDYMGARKGEVLIRTKGEYMNDSEHVHSSLIHELTHIPQYSVMSILSVSSWNQVKELFGGYSMEGFAYCAQYIFSNSNEGKIDAFMNFLTGGDQFKEEGCIKQFIQTFSLDYLHYLMQNLSQLPPEDWEILDKYMRGVFKNIEKMLNDVKAHIETLKWEHEIRIRELQTRAEDLIRIYQASAAYEGYDDFIENRQGYYTKICYYLKKY